MTLIGLIRARGAMRGIENVPIARRQFHLSPAPFFVTVLLYLAIGYLPLPVETPVVDVFLSSKECKNHIQQRGEMIDGDFVAQGRAVFAFEKIDGRNVKISLPGSDDHYQDALFKDFEGQVLRVVRHGNLVQAFLLDGGHWRPVLLCRVDTRIGNPLPW